MTSSEYNFNHIEMATGVRQYKGQCPRIVGVVDGWLKGLEVFSNLKRKSRTRTKAELSSPSKAKPLHILPGLAELEEEESRPSTSSMVSPSSDYLSPILSASRGFGGSRTLGSGARTSRVQDTADRKRDSRRVVLTGAEGLTFDDFFPALGEPRPAPSPQVNPSPPQTRRQSEDPFVVIESPLDSINFRFSGFNLEFDAPATPSSRRSLSPTPSTTIASSSSAASAASRTPIFTPPTSDDESQVKPHPFSNLTRAPTYKSQRASILFMKSMPDLQRAAAQPHPPVPSRTDDDSEDASWFANELSDIVTMATDSPESALNETRRARPDSVFPQPHPSFGRHRQSKALPSLPRLSLTEASTRGPSAQLDPTFPQKMRRAIPTRPPPPPPIRIEPAPSPTMEERTDELLALLANAAMDSAFLGTGLSGSTVFPPSLPVTPSSAFAIVTPVTARPPPRSSIPADIHDFFDDDCCPDDRDLLPDESDDGFEFDIDSPPTSTWPLTPKSISIYSQDSMSLDMVPLEMETPKAVKGGFDSSTDEIPLSPAISDSPFAGMYASDAPPRVLRSRWSSSTLSSLVDTRQAPLSPSSWKLRFNLGSSVSPTKKSHKIKTSISKPSLKATKSQTPLGSAAQTSATLERRESSSSRMSDSGSDSGESTASSGLRRKPIPIEIFMRA
ncbi:hypothetical protein BDW22DRAFT_1408069 [Trametopsis cervina]|nr:hypothetical protein BDW22DRAFT_1408069 [Trametopsis cervina]